METGSPCVFAHPSRIDFPNKMGYSDCDFQFYVVRHSLIFSFWRNMMNCLVCVKQVPDTDKITIDPVRHTLIREGVSSILNPYDGYALETALRLKEQCGGAVIVLSMGPPQAKEVLEKCLAVGADGAYLVSGKAFGGADTLATSYTLSAAAAALSRRLSLSFDLILCGKQAMDGDTAQVGPSLAQQMQLPQVTNVRELQPDGESLLIHRQTTQGEEVLRCALPALVTVSATPYALRMPTVRGKLQARKKEIPILDETCMDVDLDRCGLRGSPTRVIQTATKSVQGCCTWLSDSPQGSAAQQLAQLLTRLGAAEKGV